MTLSSVPQVAEPSTTSVPDAEAAIVRAAAEGNMWAFEQLVRLYQRRVLNFLFQMTRQHQDAEDLTQQTFVKAFQHIGRVDPERPIINWLLTIARNSALNHFRAKKKWEFVPAELTSTEPSPVRHLEHQDRTEHLWTTARRVLSQREFEVLWLRFAEERSTAETARITGLTQIHVKVLVHRARHRLQKGETKL